MTRIPTSLLVFLPLALGACPGRTIVDPDPCAADSGDDDGDGVCEVLDQCIGDDATGDADRDGVCDDRDACAGDDASGDDDGDGICGDQDACEGDDASGDSDSDGVCDDQDVCQGDDATGDRDQDGLCDDTDPCVQLTAEVHGDWCDVVFVNAAASGDGDGTTWEDGFQSLDAAAAAAVQRGGPDGPFELWLAEGTYRAPAGGEPVVTLVEGMIVRGGFTPSAVRVGDRSGGPAVLSGDFQGNDAALDLDTVEAEREAPNQRTRADNAPTVVIMASRTELDRVEVRDGYAADVRAGVGILVPAGSEEVFVRDAVIADNIGAVRNANGGGLALGRDARIEVVGTTFRHNIAWNGAGMQVEAAEYFVVEHTAFEENGALSQGAGLWIGDGEGQVDHSRFVRNRIVGNDGVAFVATRSDATISDTLFEDNVGPTAILLDAQRSFELLNLTVVGHTDSDGKGAIAGGSDTIIGNSVFWNNTRDLVVEDQRQPRELHHSCSDIDHRDWEDTNVHLDGRSAALSNPFSPGATRRYLAQEAAGDAFTSACVDLGDTDDADRAFPLWQESSTRKDGVKDGSKGDPVDAGVHYWE